VIANFKEETPLTLLNAEKKVLVAKPKSLV